MTYLAVFGGVAVGEKISMLMRITPEPDYLCLVEEFIEK